MGASPDGVVHDALEYTPDGLSEVNHIVLQGGKTLEASIARMGICKMFEGHILLVEITNTIFKYISRCFTAPGHGLTS